MESKKLIITIGIFFVNHFCLTAQTMAAPKFISIAGGWASIGVSYTRVTTAEYYIVDVAEDSLFTLNAKNIILQPLKNPNQADTSKENRSFYMYPNKRYYCRMRAANRTSMSNYSEVKSTWCTGNPPFVQLDSISQTSVTIRWSYFNVWYTSPPIPQLNLDTVPYRIILTNNDKKTIADTVVRRKYGVPTGITFNKLISNTKYGIKVVCLDEWGESGYTVNFRTSYSKLKGKDRQPIFFNEHPLARSVPWEDTSSYYSYNMTATEQATMASGDADILLSRMITDGIPIDTAWFHESGKTWWGSSIPTDLPTNPSYDGPAEFIVKLRRENEKIKLYNFYQSAGKFTIISPVIMNYRYILDDRATSVAQEWIKNDNGEIIPNPVENEYLVRYRVENTAEIELRIGDALGREWSLQAPQQSIVGVHEYRGSCRGLAAGVYTIRVIQRFRDGGMAVTPLKLYVTK